MKVAVLQYTPVYKDVEKSMDLATSLINSKISEQQQQDIDILILPEMAFTGYEFQEKSEVVALAEVATEGKTYDWCKALAIRLKCLVLCGYPEVETLDNNTTPTYYNSMLVVGPDGSFIKSVKKTFLYKSDKLWAEPGPGFQSWYCPWLDSKITFGICMDINPYEFEAPFEAYEFATFATDTESSLILFSAAWVDSNPSDDRTGTETIQYWAARLAPVIKSNHPCHFICSNRTGTELGTTFVGSSSVVSLHDRKIICHASKTEATVLIAEIKTTV